METEWSSEAVDSAAGLGADESLWAAWERYTADYTKARGFWAVDGKGRAGEFEAAAE